MSFKEILGQKEPIDFLKCVVRRNRVAHAYIFAGPPGVGKAMAARGFAELLLCQEPREDEPCGVCASCGKIKTFQHADVQWLSPEDWVIKIDAVREACRSLSLKGFESLKKILVVDGAQNLNGPSANALLKTLEEPSGHAVIILIADSLRSVIPTIASRCQRVMFRSLSVDMIAAVLTGKHHLSRQEALYLAQMAEGSLGRALRYHEEGLLSRRDNLICDLAGSASASRQLAHVPGRERREKQVYIVETLNILASWYRDILVSKFSPDPGLLVNADKRADIKAFGERLTPQILERKLAAVAETAAELDFNANINLLLAKLRLSINPTVIDSTDSK